MTPEEIEAKRIADEEAAKKKAEDDAKAKDPDGVLAKNKELLDKLAKEKAAREEIEKKLKEKEEKELKEKEDFKALAELKDKELEDLKKANAAKDEALTIQKKKSALGAELDKLGINAERKAFALKSIELSGITYDSEHDVVIGAEAKAKEFQSIAPELFVKKDPGIPGGGKSSSANIPDDVDKWWRNLSYAEKKNKDNIKAYYDKKGIAYKD